MNKDKIIEKWSAILGDLTGSTKSNWLEQYSQRIYGDMTPEEYNLAVQSRESDPFDLIQFPIVRQVQATTLASGGWIKSKKQQQKENRLNKLRKLKGKKPNVKLPNDEYIDGIVSVQPLSAPIGNLHYVDFKYGETAEEKRKKRQKERKEKLKEVDIISNLQLKLIRIDKLKYIEEIINI